MSKLSTALGSIFQATNENYAALANLKFDFSLIKMEAPVEFSGVVAALSEKRRVEAEEGPSHKIARRLGALFEDLVPSTPKLISAYGRRMSEIMSTPGVSDVGTDQHGPFKPYVGADGTALWAAATSGIPALGVYLLACLLARAFDAKYATSAWVEIVASRRRQIEEGVQNNHNISASAVVGAFQDITRNDLALWDSSARAWLRTAERATQWPQCQLDLIIKNINVPIAKGPTTYEDVLSVWKRSMSAVEQLLSGKPLDIMDGTIFTAFSAWHLFPDLIVLGAEPKKVEFKDKMFPSTGVGTVGLVSSNFQTAGVQWSLALSHLQYYGEPVMVRSDQECKRVSFAQLQLVALGSLFSAWNIARRDYTSVAEWFKLLWSRMDLPKDSSHSTTASSQFGWLLPFVAAADRLLVEKENDEHIRLLEYGKRRGKEFFSGGNRNTSPFFGLLQTPIICGLLKDYDLESGIAYLRDIAERLDLNGCEAVICYAHEAKYNSQSARYFELATVRPTESDQNLRWICGNAKYKRADNRSDSSGDFENSANISHRMVHISSQGEICEKHMTGPMFRMRGESFEWESPPSIFMGLSHVRAKGFHRIIGDHHLGLYLLKEDDKPEPWQTYKTKAEFEMSRVRKVSTAVQFFKAAKLVPGRLRDYMCFLTIPEAETKRTSMKAPGTAILTQSHQFHPDLTKCLYAFDLASKIYGHLPSATISLKIISRPLSKSAWCTSIFERWQDDNDTASTDPIRTLFLTSRCPPMPNRAESFGCVTLFDSGTVDLSPEDLHEAFAVCFEDTIYVPAVVLSDPFTRVPEYEMRSILGNFNRPGVSILVSPHEPRVRELSDSYNVVRHETYDLRREDNFKETSLHLSFTDWVVPLTTEDSRTIDHDAQIVEAVVSIRDRGRWVGDINILEVAFEDMTRFESLKCSNENHSQDSEMDYSSIDSWEEILDGPSNGTVGVFRAHGNWAARLAAVSILSRNGCQNFGIFGPEPFCLRCLEEHIETPGWEMMEYESTLPSICID